MESGEAIIIDDEDCEIINDSKQLKEIKINNFDVKEQKDSNYIDSAMFINDDSSDNLIEYSPLIEKIDASILNKNNNSTLENDKDYLLENIQFDHNYNKKYFCLNKQKKV